MIFMDILGSTVSQDQAVAGSQLEADEESYHSSLGREARKEVAVLALDRAEARFFVLGWQRPQKQSLGTPHSTQLLLCLS